MRAISLVLTAAMCLLGSAARIAAQPPTSFAELSVKVHPGKTVFVRDTAGRTFRGRVNSLTAAELVVETGSGPRRFGEGDVRELAVPGDRLVNGLAIGLASGAVIGAAIGGTFSGEFRPGDAFEGALMFGAIGAGLGLLADFAIRGKTVVYRAAPRVALAPFVTRRVIAVRTTIAW
jgi:hypothetical protein